MSACTRPELNERLVELLDGDVAELREHAAGCEFCTHELADMREAHSALAGWQVAPPSEAVLARARKVERSPALAMAGGLVAAVIAAAAMRIQPGALGEWSALVAAGLSMAAWLLGMRAVAGGRVADPAFWATAIAGASVAVASQPSGGLGTVTCLGLASLAATGPLVIAALAGTRSGGARAAWVVGAASGLLGLAVIRMHCPGGGISHALVHHLPVLLIFLVAAQIAFRLPRKA